MEEEGTPTVSLVSCMHFVRRGVAKAVPEKVICMLILVRTYSYNK